jgi:AcrR family transcriptional regulator
MPRKSNAKARRAEIAQALYRCIVRDGYLNTTTRDIAREASVNKGLIHYYFESKDEILSELFRSFFEEYSKKMSELTEANQEKSARERLRLCIEMIVTEIVGNRNLTRAFFDFWNISVHNKELRKLLKVNYRNYRRVVETIISDCLDESNNYSIDSGDLAAFIVSAFEGAGILWFNNPREFSLARLTKVTNQVLDPIIGAAK